jgi:hypothetical protein
MKVWIADELGRIKSCALDVSNETVDDQPLQSPPAAVTEEIASVDAHGQNEYVQIMTHVAWTAPDGQQNVYVPTLIPLHVSISSAFLKILIR